MEDVVIIGAGIVGSSIARELSKYNLKVRVIEKKSDVAEGSTKANSGLIHSGHDCECNSLKAKLNVQGNHMYDKLCEDLDIPFRRNGAFVLCFSKEDHSKIEALYERGLKNGVPDLSIIFKDDVLKLEPNINENVYSALYAKSAGIISPYEACIAFAENANMNGVSFDLSTEVLDIKKTNDIFEIKTSTGTISTRYVINSAGLFADEINNMISSIKYTLHPRKGEYMLLDKTAKYITDKTLFPLPTIMGKGTLITPTVHDNILIGPSSKDTDSKDNVDTSSEVLDEVYDLTFGISSKVSRRDIITSFSGLRANLEKEEDFIIEEAKDVPNFLNLIGINSPGLSSAPAIAEYVTNIVVKKLSPSLNTKFIEKRKGVVDFKNLSIDEKNELISKNKSYGKIVCRCESITEGEIIDSIKRPLGATTIDGIKRRTHQGTGRCQGGFCTSKVIDILSRELNCDVTDVTKFGGKSNLLT